MFKSFRYQYIIRQDQIDKRFSLSSEEILDIPNIPNIGVTTIPIDALKSNYFFYEGKIKEADSLLTISSKVNPHIYFSEYTKARYYMFSKRFDSAYVYAKKAFYGWPKYIEHYKIYNETLVQRKDTLEILNAFDSINKLFLDRYEYYENFLTSLTNAKLRYLITSYDSIVPVSKDILEGSWQQVYEFETNEITRIDNNITFSDNKFINNTSEFRYRLKKDSLFIRTNKTHNLVATYPIFFAPKRKTLILKNVPKVITLDSILYQDQFFKKIE